MLKKVRIGLLSVLAAVILLIVSVMVIPVRPNQALVENVTFPIAPSLENTDYNFDSLNRLYGTNKRLPKNFEKQALLALAAYPELKEVSISFELVNYGAPLESTFQISTLLGAGSKRKYRILIYDSPGASGFFYEILLRNLPFDSQVGILAHELGHTVYYHEKSTWAILKWAVCYALSPEFRSVHEKSTDLLPVYRGLGYQVYDYARYVRTNPKTKPLYESAKGFIDQYYHTHDRILAEFDRVSAYRLPVP